MNDLRLSWYRQRAEEEGQQAWVLMCWHVENERDPDRAFLAAREAAHYANLVLGPVEVNSNRYGILPCTICGSDDHRARHCPHSAFGNPLHPDAE